MSGLHYIPSVIFYGCFGGSGMSFHEKSALACLISICCVYVPYFFLVFRFPMAALGLFWVAAIGLAALLAVRSVPLKLCNTRIYGDVSRELAVCGIRLREHRLLWRHRVRIQENRQCVRS
jgi:hypothetical protein